MSNQFYNDGKPPHNFKSLVGERFGRLTVLRFMDTTRHGLSRWICQCDCGSQTVVIGGNLHTKQIQSCGCLRRENSALHGKKFGGGQALPVGEAQRNAIFSRYKNQAAKANRKFTLTFETFCVITKQDCYYCGNVPRPFAGAGQSFNGRYVGNGIDRVDNAGGYTPDNVVPCCTQCNQSKRALSHEEFIGMVHRIAKRHPIIARSLPVA